MTAIFFAETVAELQGLSAAIKTNAAIPLTQTVAQKDFVSFSVDTGAQVLGKLAID